MLGSRLRVLTIVSGLAIVVLAMPAVSAAGLFGCHSCAAPAAPVVATPACATCAPPTVTYMPTPVYRALYQPAVAAYQPAASYSAYTTYRPVFGGWAYQSRLVPYTTYYQPSSYTAYYQPTYYAAMPVATYSGCSSCASYTPCDSCSPCSGGACAGGACGTVSYEAPASGCASCAASTTVVTPAPASSNQSPPRTFQEEKAQKPTTEAELKPIPRSDTQLNSMPLPVLPDPQDRTAARTDYSTARVRLVASPIQAAPASNDDGWRPARD